MKTLTFSFAILVGLLVSGVSQDSAAQDSGEILRVSARLPQLPLIGDRAPEFAGQSTEGIIEFPKDYVGKWVILFSHPADFTPVCTSEFVLLGSMAPEFKKLNAELLGLSIGEVKKHQEWTRSIEENIEYAGIKNQKISFPIVADTDQEIAWRYGMLHPSVSSTETVRAMFIIDPKGIIRAMTYYPPEVGRNIGEIKRMLVAIQTAEAYRVATPANWNPGEDALVRSGAEQDRADQKCQEWYFCFQELDKSKLSLP